MAFFVGIGARANGRKELNFVSRQGDTGILKYFIFMGIIVGILPKILNIIYKINKLFMIFYPVGDAAMDLLSCDFVGFENEQAVIFDANDKGHFNALSGGEIQRPESQLNGVDLIEGNNQNIEGYRIKIAACVLQTGQTIHSLVLRKLNLPAFPEVPESADV